MVEISINNKYYPQKLRCISKPPEKLYCKGNLDLLESNIISIIGSRACSDFGIAMTKKFSKELVEQEITIASGLAKRN